MGPFGLSVLFGSLLRTFSVLSELFFNCFVPAVAMSTASCYVQRLKTPQGQYVSLIDF